MATNYEIGPILGKGSFANVHLARDVRNRRRCAIKIVDMTLCCQRQGNNTHADEPYSMVDLLRREVDVMSSISTSRHPNLVLLLESFSYTNQTTGSEMFGLVLEECSGGDLQNYMKNIRDQRKQQQTNLLPGGTFLSVNEIRHALSQVLCGLSFLHSRGICHRDVKASNIFLCPIQTSNQTTPKGVGKQANLSLLDCTLKLGDFGLAVQMKDTDEWGECCATFCGTPCCLAPEVVSLYVPNVAKNSSSAALGPQQSMFENHTGYGQPADLWSVGCLLFTMISGRNPFSIAAPPTQDIIEKTKRMQQIMQRVICGDWSLPANVRIEEPLEILLHQLLDDQPKNRGSARAILSSHPFFQADSTRPGSSMQTPKDLGPDNVSTTDARQNKENRENGNFTSVGNTNKPNIEETNHPLDSTKSQHCLPETTWKDLEAAKAAASEISAELLKLREKKQGIPQDVLDMNSDSGGHASNVDVVTNDGMAESVMHYFLNGQAGVIRLDSNSRLSRDDLIANLI